MTHLVSAPGAVVLEFPKKYGVPDTRKLCRWKEMSSRSINGQLSFGWTDRFVERNADITIAIIGHTGFEYFKSEKEMAEDAARKSVQFADRTHEAFPGTRCTRCIGQTNSVFSENLA